MKRVGGRATAEGKPNDRKNWKLKIVALLAWMKTENSLKV